MVEAIKIFCEGQMAVQDQSVLPDAPEEESGTKQVQDEDTDAD
jgi:hypothetical protein